MNTPIIGSIVRVKVVDFVKKTKAKVPSYEANFRGNFHKVAVPSEIIGMVNEIKNGNYFVQLGNYEDNKFKPSKETRDFSEVYMLRFARVIG
jgi:hypothetical protein